MKIKDQPEWYLLPSLFLSCLALIHSANESPIQSPDQHLLIFSLFPPLPMLPSNLIHSAACRHTTASVSRTKLSSHSQQWVSYCTFRIRCYIWLLKWALYRKSLQTKSRFVNISNTILLNPLTRKAEEPASPAVTNSRKAEIPACRSLIYSCKAKISAWKFRKKTVKNNVVSESSMSGDPMLWQLRVERVNLFVNNDTKQQKRTTDNRQSALWVVHCRQPAQLFCSTDKSANRQFLSSVSRLTSVRDASNWLCNRSKQFQPNVFNSSRYSTNQADLFCMKSEVTIMTRCNTVSSQLFNLSNITRKNSTKSHWCIRFHLFWPYMVWSWPWPLIFWPHFAQVAQPPITHVNQLKLLSFNVLWQQHGPKVDFCPYLVW